MYYPYHLWEDYQNGMYSKPKENQHHLIQQSIELLGNAERLKAVMQRVVREWPLSTSHNFHNGGLNRRSWLGQAACNMDHGIPELLNRAAWNSLTEQQMKAANRVADQIIQQWERENEKTTRHQRTASRPEQGVLDF